MPIFQVMRKPETPGKTDETIFLNPSFDIVSLVNIYILGHFHYDQKEKNHLLKVNVTHYIQK